MNDVKERVNQDTQNYPPEFKLTILHTSNPFSKALNVNDKNSCFGRKFIILRRDKGIRCKSIGFLFFELFLCQGLLQASQG